MASSLLRPSVASRLLASRHNALYRPVFSRFESSKSPTSSEVTPQTSPDERPSGAMTKETNMIRKENSAEGQPRHSPDWNAAVDYRTS